MATPNETEILLAARANLSPERISRMLKVPLPEVVATLRQNGVFVAERVERPYKQRPQSVSAPKPPRLKVNPVKMAMQVFNGRAQQTETAFYLDGQPIGSFDLIRRANRVLKDNGMPQIDGCEEWIIGD